MFYIIYRGRVAPGASALSFSAQKSFTENPDFLDVVAFFPEGLAVAFVSFFGVFFLAMSGAEFKDSVIS